MAKIALHNVAGVDAEALGLIAEASELPGGTMCLVVGDPALSEDLQGCTVARAFVRWAGNIHGLRAHLREDWECGVVIGQKWAKLQPEFPAYFAYLLGHEFGHATTVLTRLWLAVYEDMILRYVPRIVTDREWRCDAFPHEVRYDQFGMAVAEAVYGRMRLEHEFGRIMAEGLTEDAPRLEKALTLEPSRSLDSLPAELAEFSLPYRDALLERWADDIQKGSLKLGSFLRDLKSLWTQGA